MKLILASQSPYRQKQLQSLGLPFGSHSPAINEEEWKNRNLESVELASVLAQEKALSLKARFPEDALLGGDQVVLLDGKILGKPASKERAQEQLAQMSGRTHQLLTAIYLHTPEKAFQHLDVTEITFRALSSQQIDRYVEIDQPLDCAGSYKIEAAGPRLIESVNTKDPTAIVGLPLLTLMSWLYELGLA